jgi:hypothetical protein
MLACHAGDPGSIPGSCKFSFRFRRPRSLMVRPMTILPCVIRPDLFAGGVHALFKKTLKPTNNPLNPSTPDCPGTPCHAHTYWRSEGGARCSRGGENPTETCTYLVTGPGSRHGLGPASLGHGRWRIPAILCLPARVMSDLPRWHTQRCGRCQNSRYLHGQTRALPLSSASTSRRSARTSPSTILRHRPPVNSPDVLSD